VPFHRRLRGTLLSACVLVPTFLVAGPASAATVALGSRTFDAACNAAASGDIVTVPAGSYGSQTITCAKAVTFLGQGNPTVAYVSFSNANGPAVDGMTLTGGFESKGSKNIAVRNSTLYNLSYIEGTTDLVMDHNVHTSAPGGTSWSNGDMVDIYEQTGRVTNARITISDSVFHGLRAPNAASHSDAIQLCNCSSAGDSIHPIAIKIQRNKFYDNECMNIRTNANDDLLFESNLVGDTITGISGCGAYSADMLAANATVRYNTFTGKQQIQVNTTADYGQSQTWTGNAGVGMSSACGAIRGTYANNVWTAQKCGATDKQVASLKLNSDGSPQAGSPLIDAGSMSNYPAVDIDGEARFTGAAPDAGAFESAGATTPPPTTPPPTTPPPTTPPADTTAPTTTITAVPADSTSTSAALSFTSNESGSTFACKLDAGAFAACTSPKRYTGLAVGSHTFSVRATDRAGNTDASLDSASWRVVAATPPAGDKTAPQTSITSVPASSTSTSATVAFTATESGGTFTCRLDAGTWAACTSPATLRNLRVEAHTFEVRATDAAGNTDATPASARWTTSAPATPAPPVTAPTPGPAIGLVAAYGFSEASGTAVKDSTGHGLTGVRTGALMTNFGHTGRGLSFDGDHDQVRIADDNRLDLTKGMTLEAWVRPATTSGWRTLIAKEQPGSGLSYGLYSSSTTGKPSANVFTTSQLDTRGTAALTLDVWSHLAATYNGTTLTIFVNGVAASTRSVPGSLRTSTGVLRIGGTSVWGEWFKGKLDDVRVYDKALTATQIKSDMKVAVS
jgi:hypothetical protein